ncbi:MAG TPA: DUF1223 domain-containing protein [Bryobacteraceae bacterium]|jgi:hypothetical protein|nr:DUF1223 domain-containing protein [Bryobacteraceae bacterium]
MRINRYWLAAATFPIVAGILSLGGPRAAAATRTPVLLELFTSEGCSSCPPADKLLDELDRTQPFPEAEVMVLSEHVDYWDQLGWKDHYSSAIFSARQRQYAAHLGEQDVYTPELVIDGKWTAVGSDLGQIRRTVEKASRQPKLPIHLEVSRNGNSGAVRVDISSAAGTPPGDVYIVLAKNHVTSHVEHGENAHLTLSHTAVAYQITKLGDLRSGNPFEKQLTIDLPSGGGQARVIAYVQEPATGRIIGSAEARL